MKIRKSLSALAVALALSLATASAHAQIFQYRFPYMTEGGKPTEAFLWLPADAKAIRGVVIAGMTLAERELVKDPAIRKACAEQSIAVIFLRTGLGTTDPEKLLNELARTTGYKELAAAPMFFIGHSAGGPQAKDRAVRYANRCFGLMQYRGGGPFNGEPVPNGIPTLMMVGQFDEFGGDMRKPDGYESWQRSTDQLTAHRAEDEKRIASAAIEPGAGHFAWSPRNGAYLGLFIKKAAAARIPAEWSPDNGAPKLIAVAPESGWLSDMSLKTAATAAPYAAYTGDKSKANWHFDQQFAEATIAYHKGLSKKDQFLRWTDSYWVDAGTRYFFNNIKWVGDGQTFEVSPVYADKYPMPEKGGGPRWPDLAGTPVGQSKAPIKLKLVSGPIAVASDRTFRMNFDALSPAGEPSRATFMAYSEGDNEFRHTELVGMLPRGFNGIADGKENKITFDPIDSPKLGGAPVALKAAASSELPVNFYVAYGPAIVENNTLKLAEVPARATFPIEIKVVAYQFGKGTEPKVRTATPVERTVTLTK